MRISSLFAGLLLPSAALSQTLFSNNQEPIVCPKAGGVHFLGIRGHGGGIPPDPNRWNVLTTYRDLVLAQINGSNANALAYDYNLFLQPVGLIDGAFKLRAYLRKFIDACPDSMIVLHGYSEGAMTVMDSLCGVFAAGGILPTLGLPLAWRQNIVAVTLWGDESRDGNQPWNAGTCSPDYDGEFARIFGDICTPWGAHIQSYCDQGDEYCCYGEGTADTGRVHANYRYKYSQAGVDWIKKRIAARAAGVTSIVVGNRIAAPTATPSSIDVPVATLLSLASAANAQVTPAVGEVTSVPAVAPAVATAA